MNRTQMIYSLVMISALSGNVFADSSFQAQAPKTAASVAQADRLFLVTRSPRGNGKNTLINTVTAVNKDDSGKVISYEIASDQGTQIIKADSMAATHTSPVAGLDLIADLEAKSGEHFIDIDKASVEVLVKSEKAPTTELDKSVLNKLKVYLSKRPNFARTGLARFGNLNESGLYGKIDRSVKAKPDPRSLPVTATRYGAKPVVQDVVKEGVKAGVEDAVRE